MRQLLPAVLLTASLFLAACTGEKTTTYVPPPTGTTATAQTLDAKCGCAIEGVGKCGNYVLVDGKYVPLVNPTLGKMEFCAQGKAGAKIEASGAMQDGQFVAANWKRVP
ncbi:MAG: hypothetical protein KF830_04105 [Planctomycetes bacterium]|nr:hypothetical protein [Planctomycetota bacterium]